MATNKQPRQLTLELFRTSRASFTLQEIEAYVSESTQRSLDTWCQGDCLAIRQGDAKFDLHFYRRKDGRYAFQGTEYNNNYTDDDRHQARLEYERVYGHPRTH